MVEGRELPKDLPKKTKKKFITNILPRFGERFFGTQKVLIHDSGFWVLQGILELINNGIILGGLIKKRSHWTKMVLGGYIGMYFENNEGGACDSLIVKLDDIP